VTECSQSDARQYTKRLTGTGISEPRSHLGDQDIKRKPSLYINVPFALPQTTLLAQRPERRGERQLLKLDRNPASSALLAPIRGLEAQGCGMMKYQIISNTSPAVAPI
jgi:hypothetical protein